MPVLSIDLKNIDPKDTFSLYIFFKTESANGAKLWEKDKTYTFWDGTQFTLQQNVFARLRKSRGGVPSTEIRYQTVEHFAEPMGKGSTARVYNTDTLAFDHHGSSRFKKEGKDGNGRVVKVTRFHRTFNRTSMKGVKTLMLPKDYPLAEIWVADNDILLQRERRHSEKVGHLHIKSPTIIPIRFITPEEEEASLTTFFGLTVMDKLPGKNFFQILSDDSTGKSPLSIKQRIALSKLLIVNVHDQTFKKEIVHQDIKPDNIIVFMEQGQIFIYVIDYAFASSLRDCSDTYGTGNYRAPEFFSFPFPSSADKRDIFSLGCTLADLWHYSLAGYPVEVRLGAKDEIFAQWLDLIFLNEWKPHMGQESADLIKDIIKGMVRINPDDRLSFEQAVKLAEKIPMDPSYVAESKNPNPPVPAKVVQPTAASKIDYFFGISRPPTLPSHDSTMELLAESKALAISDGAAVKPKDHGRPLEFWEEHFFKSFFSGERSVLKIIFKTYQNAIIRMQEEMKNASLRFHEEAQPDMTKLQVKGQAYLLSYIELHEEVVEKLSKNNDKSEIQEPIDTFINKTSVQFLRNVDTVLLNPTCKKHPIIAAAQELQAVFIGSAEGLWLDFGLYDGVINS